MAPDPVSETERLRRRVLEHDPGGIAATDLPGPFDEQLEKAVSIQGCMEPPDQFHQGDCGLPTPVGFCLGALALRDIVERDDAGDHTSILVPDRCGIGWYGGRGAVR